MTKIPLIFFFNVLPILRKKHKKKECNATVFVDSNFKLLINKGFLAIKKKHGF